ncbi:hypothetical protein O6H91_18G072900 [Diphasiastrum complanatum]|uniref:Uncharacterized protein n=1 Tax=Diphasiastrum complanatum TaxID=34168 RepID=A0ACC2B2K5_DIPCM|nr:hypothetical protein O6H91_18G072900 [Diphasiastrum complanatum]
MNSTTRLSEGTAEVTVNQGFASADTRSRNLQLSMNILAASRLYVGAILQNWLFNAKLQIQHKLHPRTIQTWERLQLKLKQLFENLEPILITAWSIGCNQGILAATVIQKLILVLLEWWARRLLSVFRLSLATLFFSLWCAALNLCILVVSLSLALPW